MPMTAMIHAVHVTLGVQETCDGVDNNCDGTVDEVNAVGCVDYYQDLDGDGFGSSTHSVNVVLLVTMIQR